MAISGIGEWWDATISKWRTIAGATASTTLGDNPGGTDKISYYGPLPVAIAGATTSDSVQVDRVDSTKDEDLDADRNIILNQLHYTSPAEILAFTNMDNSTARAVFDVQSYPYWSLDIIESDAVGTVTYKVFITNRSDADNADETDGNWHDYSTTILGAATIVDSNGYYIQDTPLTALKVMLHVVTSDTTNSFSAVLTKAGA